MVRWPGKVPAGVVTEEMLSAHDWYTTFAALAGASDKVPTDRPIDGIDASRFLLGESATSGRESFLFFGPDGSLMSVKWHNMKAVLRYSEGIDQPIVTPQWPMLFDLASDPNELYNIMATKMAWAGGWGRPQVRRYRKRASTEHQDGEEFEATNTRRRDIPLAEAFPAHPHRGCDGREQPGSPRPETCVGSRRGVFGGVDDLFPGAPGAPVAVDGSGSTSTRCRREFRRFVKAPLPDLG